jgi:sugar phosphate permease
MDWIASIFDGGCPRWFNLAQGLVALATGLGASLSNVVAGFVVQRFDYPTGFMTLAAIAIIALGFFTFLMPETGSQRRTTADLPTVSDGARVRTND